MKYYRKAIRLEVPENVYYPREDSELLADWLEKIDVKGREVLEIGCGSGLLSIIAAKQGGNVACVDMDQRAVDLTLENAGVNNAVIKASQSDLFENVRGKYDVIVFNPPYLPVESGENDPAYAGGESGRETIEKFIKDVPRFLQPIGRVFLLISSLTGEQEVVELARKAGLKAIVIARKKVPWEELIVLEMAR